MTMGMDYAWHESHPELTETDQVSAQDASETEVRPERRAEVSAKCWRSLYIQSNRWLRLARTNATAMGMVVDLLTDDVENLRSAFNLSRATVAQQKLAIERLRERLAAAQRDLTQAQIINAGHASWRRDAEAEYESVRKKLDKHFLLPHLSALDMAAALAKVRPVGGPPFDLVDGVRQVVHELLHLRAENAGLRQSLADLSAAPEPGTFHLVISWDPARENSEEERLEIGRVHAEALAVLMASEGRKRLLVERDRMRARLESLATDVVNECSQDDIQEYQCDDCGEYASTADEIRHVAGTRIDERACPYLLTMRALGRPVLDDSEEVASVEPRLAPSPDDDHALELVFHGVSLDHVGVPEVHHLVATECTHPKLVGDIGNCPDCGWEGPF